MGLVKSGLFWIVIVLFAVSLLVFSTLTIISTSLSYKNVDRNLVPLFSELAVKNLNLSNTVSDITSSAEIYCKNNNNKDYVTVYGGYSVSIPCSTFALGEEAVLNEIVNDAIYDIYYEDYNCNFWDCFKKQESPLFFISEKAKNYWHQKIYFFLISSLVLLGILFFLVEKRLNWFFAIGITIIASSLPLLKIKSFFSFIAGFFVSFIGDSIDSLLNIFFSKAITVFIIMFFLGLVILGTGIALKFVNLGFVKKFLEQDSAEITKISDKNKVTKKGLKNK